MRALAVVLFAGSLYGQCVMCQRTAAAQQGARAQVLNKGILVLLIPPFAIVGGILWMAKRGSR